MRLYTRDSQHMEQKLYIVWLDVLHYIEVFFVNQFTKDTHMPLNKWCIYSMVYAQGSIERYWQ